MEPKKSYFAVIPASVRYCEGLNANAKLLYGEITALCNEQGYCWANNHYFAELYKVDKLTISRWISALKNEGFIRMEVVQEKGNTRRLYVTEPYIQKGQEVLTKSSIGSIQKDQEGIDEIVKHNNTINNTKNNTERESRALDFLKENYSFRFEQWCMQNKAAIKDFEKFCLDFNDVADQEELKFEGKILFARLGRYSRNWVQNQEKYTPKEDLKDAPRNYLKNIL